MKRSLFYYTIIFGFFSMLITSCNGDGGEGELRTPDDPSGDFLNGTVSGVEYRSTGLSGWQGVTENGSFMYHEGDEINFSVGGINLGTAEGERNITPVDLVPGAVDSSDPAAINMTRFLISIDQDGNYRSNGISVSEETREALAESSLDFSDPSFDESAQNILISLSTNENGDGVFAEEQRALVPAEEAESFLAEAIAEIEEEELQAEAEASRLTAAIYIGPYNYGNVVLVQGQPLSVSGAVKGGSGQYSYEWYLDDQLVSQELNPPAFISSLAPGTYGLSFIVTDSDGLRSRVDKLITVWDSSEYAIPITDQKAFVSFVSGISMQNIAIEDTINIQADISMGNPPFYYTWNYPSGVTYTFEDSPLDAMFTFSSAGTYSILFQIYDSQFDTKGPDVWVATMRVEVR